MIVCYHFIRSIKELPRLKQLLENEFQNGLFVYESEHTVFVYNISEHKARYTMFILEIANIQVGYGIGKKKQEALEKAKRYIQHHEMVESITGIVENNEL